MQIKASQFLDRDGRRVLTDDGWWLLRASNTQPGRGGLLGMGSTTEQMQGAISAAIYAHGPRMNNAQLDEIIGWLEQYKTNLTRKAS